MTTLSLSDEAGAFDLTRIDATTPSRVVLFAVGGGGNPERHLPLLRALADRGCTVVAPHFERFVSPAPTAAQLLLRARRLRIALDSAYAAAVPVVGVGHSIGATTLLALAGAAGTTRAGEPMTITRDDRLTRLALFAPATNFFARPGALDDLRATVLAWAGTNDAITPPAQAALLRDARSADVEVRIVEGAGHFSFMNAPPPGTSEPLADRDAFLAELEREVGDFIAAAPPSDSPAGPELAHGSG